VSPMTQAMLVCSLSFLFAAAAVADVTVTFQQGVNGYSGTVDTQITKKNLGGSYGTATTLKTNLNGGAINWESLLRFENIIGTDPGQIPPGANIKSASITKAEHRVPLTYRQPIRGDRHNGEQLSLLPIP